MSPQNPSANNKAANSKAVKPNQQEEHSDIQPSSKIQEDPSKVDQEELLVNMEVSLNHIEKQSIDDDDYDYAQSNQFQDRYNDIVQPVATSDLDDYDVDPPSSKILYESNDYPGYSREVQQDNYGEVDHDNEVYGNDYYEQNSYSKDNEYNEQNYYVKEPEYNEPNFYAKEPEYNAQPKEVYFSDKEEIIQQPSNYESEQNYYRQPENEDILDYRYSNDNDLPQDTNAYQVEYQEEDIIQDERNTPEENRNDIQQQIDYNFYDSNDDQNNEPRYSDLDYPQEYKYSQEPEEIEKPDDIEERLQQARRQTELEIQEEIKNASYSKSTYMQFNEERDSLCN